MPKKKTAPAAPLPAEGRMEAIYSRQSVDKKDSLSIETQLELCRSYLTPGAACEVYVDRGFSGKNTNRPAFQRMMSDIRGGRIGKVVIYRLDRMTRSVLDFAQLIDEFRKYRTSFVSTQEHFDTSTPMGEAMLSICMVFAQLERETIATRVRDNYYHRGEKGYYLGGPAPYGYKGAHVSTDGGERPQLAEDERESQTLKKIFEAYGRRMLSLTGIARMLNEEGTAPPGGGGGWSGNAVSRLLRNPVCVRSDINIYRYYSARGCIMDNEPERYCRGNGLLLFGRRESNERKYTDLREHHLSAANHEGIIDADLFLRCQRRLDGNAQIDNRSWGARTWLTGLVKCGVCGYAAIPKSSDGGKYLNFYCSGRASQNCGVSRNLGRVDEIESAVLTELSGYIKTALSCKIEIKKDRTEDMVSAEAEIERITRERERAVDLALETGPQAAALLEARISDCNKRLDGLRRRLGAMQEDCAAEERSAGEAVACWAMLTNPQRNEIAALLIDKILLERDENGRIVTSILWKYGPPPG